MLLFKQEVLNLHAFSNLLLFQCITILMLSRNFFLIADTLFCMVIFQFLLVRQAVYIVEMGVIGSKVKYISGRSGI